MMTKLFRITGLEVIKLFLCSTQLSTKFQLLIKTKIPKNEYVSCFFFLSDVVFIMLINVKMPTIVGILTLMSRINFVLSWVKHEKKIYNLDVRSNSFDIPMCNVNISHNTQSSNACWRNKNICNSCASIRAITQSLKFVDNLHVQTHLSYTRSNFCKFVIKSVCCKFCQNLSRNKEVISSWSYQYFFNESRHIREFMTLHNLLIIL